MTAWPQYSDVFLRIFILMAMVGGLASLPLLPGLVIIWAAALLFGILAGFGTLGWIMFVLLTLLMLAGTIVDNVLMGMQAHKEGAPWWVVLLALLAAIIGSFVIPIPILGGILAALLVLFGIEWARRKDWRKALLSIRGMLVGWGWAFVIRFIIGLVMIILWSIWAWA
jgi:uncharacterized protein